MRKEVAASFFEQYLPAAITEHFHWPSLELEPTSFVDDSLKHQESDLLFNVKLSGHSASLYVLFEHQKKPDRWMPLRLLSYMVAFGTDGSKIMLMLSSCQRLSRWCSIKAHKLGNQKKA